MSQTTRETIAMILQLNQKIPIVGYLNNPVFFSIIAQIKAMMTPIRVEPKNTPRKVMIPLKMLSTLISLPRNLPNVLKSTIATESFKIDSPNIIANNLGST